MVYERLMVGSVNGELKPPHREVIELRWNGESSWRRTILYSDAGTFGSAGQWQQADGVTLTSSYSDPDTVDEPDGVWAPEVWFRQPPLRPRAESERIERIAGSAYTRWTREHRFNCNSGQPSLLCHVTRGEPGVDVETIIYNSHGIPVSYIDTVNAVAIETVSMLSLEVDSILTD